MSVAVGVAEGPVSQDHGKSAGPRVPAGAERAGIEEQPSLSTAATLVQMLTNSRLNRAIHTAAELRVADVVLQLGGTSTISVARLATALRLEPSVVDQLMCCLASAGIFQQDSDQEGERYGLNPLARHLLSAAPWSLRTAVLIYGEQTPALIYGEEIARVRRDAAATVRNSPRADNP